MIRILILLTALGFNWTVRAEGFFETVVLKAETAYVNTRVEMIYENAHSCHPLELDARTGKTVDDWINMKPNYPNAQLMERLPNVAEDAKKYAETKNGTDKVKHCFAGCFIRQNLDKTSALFVAWLKELMDASDCNPQTHFEESDYFATVAGALVGKNMSCEKFCYRRDVMRSTGEEMYEKALRLRR
jgi:hypothetical protein